MKLKNEIAESGCLKFAKISGINVVFLTILKPN